MHKNCQLFLQLNAVADSRMLDASINAARFCEVAIWIEQSLRCTGLPCSADKMIAVATTFHQSEKRRGRYFL